LASYPGTPSSEIGQAVIDAARDLKHMYVEWSVNEKVAFEVAYAASMTRCQDHDYHEARGSERCSRPAYDRLQHGGGRRDGAGGRRRPAMHSSQNEQDSRYVARQGYLPVFEPSTGQEAKDMMADAFRLSEEWGQIVMLRSVTRLSHARSKVTLGEIDRLGREAEFDKDSSRWVCQPTNSRRHRLEMLERLARIKAAADAFPYNKLDARPGAKLGIIACGLGWAYLKEAVDWLGIADQVSCSKLGMTYPIPEGLVAQLLESVPQVLVVEEGEPIVEQQVKWFAQENRIDRTIHGKDVVPVVGELSTRKLMESLAKVLDVRCPWTSGRSTALALKPCPYCLCARRPSARVVRTAPLSMPKARRYASTNGSSRWTSPGAVTSAATAWAFFAPLSSDDTHSAWRVLRARPGISQAIGARTVAHIGDSTFFHSGMAPLVNAVFKQGENHLPHSGQRHHRADRLPGGPGHRCECPRGRDRGH